MLRALISRHFNSISNRLQSLGQQQQQLARESLSKITLQSRGALQSMSLRSAAKDSLPGLPRTTKLSALSLASLASLPLFCGSAAASTLVPGIGSVSEMGMLGWFLVDLAINVAGWAVAATYKTEKFYDLVGSLSFGTLTAGTLLLSGPICAKKILVSAMVGVWTGRLGYFLVQRVHKVGEDSRFREVKHQPGMFLVYWTMQAVWVFTTLLPVLVVNSAKTVSPLGILDLLGFAVYATGLTLEVVADSQKGVFRENPENKGGFIQEGLWSWSRHPNYFGEMVIWSGMWLTCASSFTQPWHAVTLASPLFVIYLIRYVSGVPLLEASADKKWGGQADYEAYKASTSILVPLPPKKNDS